MKIALRHTAMLVFVLVASALGTLSPASDSPAPRFIGTWQGTLEIGAYKLRIVFDIKTAAEGSLAWFAGHADAAASEFFPRSKPH